MLAYLDGLYILNKHESVTIFGARTKVWLVETFVELEVPFYHCYDDVLGRFSRCPKSTY